MKKRGCPSTYTPELAAEAFEPAIPDSGESTPDSGESTAATDIAAATDSSRQAMIEVREVAVSDYIDRVVDLLRAHWLETESELAPAGPKPLVSVYLALEKAGNTIAFGAFEGDTMVGYSVAILGPHLHYGMTYAHHDLLYVSPKHRRGTLGLKLMRATERTAKAGGAAFSTWHAKPGSTLESILSRTGYQCEEIVYKKDL